MFRDIDIVNEAHVVEKKFFNPEDFDSIEAYERVSKQLVEVMDALSKGEKIFQPVLCKLAEKYKCKIFINVVTSKYIDSNCQFQG